LALRREGGVVEWPVTAPANATHNSAIAAGSGNGLALIGNGPPVFPGLTANRTVRRGSPACFRMMAVGALPITYQWNCNGTNIPGATNSFFIEPNVQPNQASNYYSLTASNAFGTATSGAMVLSEVPLEVGIQPQTLTALLGENGTFNATALGEGPFGYQWQFDGTNIDGATNASLFLTYLQLNQSGAYSVVVRNIYGSVTNSSAGLSVVPLLLTGQPQGQTVPAGTNITLGVTATGQQLFSYQWMWNDTNLIGATNASLGLSNIQFDEAGNYAVLVSNTYGAVMSSTAVLSVAPLVISSQPQPQTVVAGTIVTFSAVATGQALFNYQWLWNGTNLVDATNASLVLTNVEISQTGSYSVVISNMYGAVESSGALLTLAPLSLSSQPQPQTAVAGL
jgi:Immunoglobulin domain